MTAGSALGFPWGFRAMPIPNADPDDPRTRPTRTPFDPAQMPPFVGVRGDGGLATAEPGIAMDEDETRRLEREAGMVPEPALSRHPEPNPVQSDVARLLDRASMGPAQSFSGSAGAVADDRAARPEQPLQQPVADVARPPAPVRYAGLAGQATAEQPSAGGPPVATIAMPGQPGFGDRFASGLRQNGDLLIGLGTGLLSTPGFGAGAATGLQFAQRAERDRATTDLARAELGLKQRKLAQETAALGGNAAIIKRAFPNLSETEAIAAGANGGQVTEALRILRDPTHGTGLSRVTIGGNIHELRPGDRPSAENLVGTAEAGPDQIRAKAQAQAEGAAAGKPDETYSAVPEDERARLGLPAGSYQRDSKGKVHPINPAGTVINMGAEKAQDAKVGGGLGEYQLELATKGRNAASTLNTLALMEQAMKTPGFYSGVGGEGVKRANQFLGALGVKDPKAASAAEVFDALSNKVVLDGLGGSLGPGISNTDRDYISRTAPTLAQSEEGNRALIGIARALAQRQQAVAKLSRDYAARNGGRIDGGFDQALEDFAAQNPLFPQAGRGATAMPPHEPSGAPLAVGASRDFGGVSIKRVR